MYKAYIFDMDGTILNTIDDLTDSTNYAMEKMGYQTYTVEDVKGFVGNGIMRLILNAVPEGISEEDVKKTHSYFMEHYLVHCKDKTGPYDGIKDLLKFLKEKGKKLAVVSNKADAAVKILADEEFPGLFDIAIGEKEGINKKPARDMVDIALKELGCDRSEAVYIGDSEVDFKTSVNSELDCILVSWGFRDRKVLETFGAKYLVDSPTEIMDI